MTNQSTIDKLIEMRLTSMSDAFITQMDDPKMDLTSRRPTSPISTILPVGSSTAA